MNTIKTLLFLATVFTVTAHFLNSPGHPTSPRAQAEETPPSVDEIRVSRAAAPAKPAAPQAPLEAAPARPAPRAPSPLAVALQAADLCQTYKLLSQEYKPREHMDALLSSISPSPALLEAYGADGPYFSPTVSAHTKYKHTVARFLHALRLGGLLYISGGNSEADLTAAQEILLELEKKEPANAAYPYFRLAIEEKLKLAPEKLLATARRIAQSSYMDTHYDPLAKELMEAKSQNPAIHYAASYFVDVNPINFQPTAQVLRRLESEQAFDGVETIGNLLLEKGLRASRSWRNGDYNLYEYSIGKELAPRAQAPNADGLPSSAEINAMPQPPSLWRESPDGTVSTQECDPSRYEAYFYEYRGRF